MRLFLGIITDVVDDTKFYIKFTIKNYIENCIAYPIDVIDQPHIGDTVVLYEIDNDILGCSYLYQRLRTKSSTEISIGDASIRMTKDKVYVASGKSKVSLDNTGNITIESASNIEIKGANNVTLNSPSIRLRGVSGSSGFNCIPVCPYTGEAHITTDCE